MDVLIDFWYRFLTLISFTVFPLFSSSLHIPTWYLFIKYQTSTRPEQQMRDRNTPGEPPPPKKAPGTFTLAPAPSNRTRSGESCWGSSSSNPVSKVLTQHCKKSVHKDLLNLGVTMETGINQFIYSPCWIKMKLWSQKHIQIEKLRNAATDPQYRKQTVILHKQLQLVRRGMKIKAFYLVTLQYKNRKDTQIRITQQQNRKFTEIKLPK